MTWLLIDGNNWFAQCDYANPDNSQINFVRRLETLLAQVTHSRCVVCWDGGRSFRHEMADSYKAHRADKPPEFHQRQLATQAATKQVAEMQQVEGFEADDVIATLTATGIDEGERVVIFSADHDLHQLLVAGQVSQVIKVTRRSQTILDFDTVTAHNLSEIYGVEPFQWVDYRAIVGDKSDGIVGCPGLGPKAAKALLQWRPSLDEFFDAQWSAPISDRQMKALSAYKDELPFKRKLLTLVREVPLAPQQPAS